VTVGEDTFPVSSGDEQLVCDGRTHSDSVTIDVTNAPWGSWDALKAGMAWAIVHRRRGRERRVRQ